MGSVGGGGVDSLFEQDGDVAVNSKGGVSGNDSLDGGAGTDTKTTDTIEKSFVGFPQADWRGECERTEGRSCYAPASFPLPFRRSS